MKDSISFSLHSTIVLKRFEQSVAECVSLKGYNNYVDSTKINIIINPNETSSLNQFPNPVD
jgi:hypothetical protein